MSVDLFPNDRFGAEDKYDNFKDAVKECSWLIEEIVKPQLPNIIDNFSKCLEMLESDQIFKMPVSNGIPNESNKQNDSPTVLSQDKANTLLTFTLLSDSHNFKGVNK
ncbi:ATV_HP_G0015020.mRNA.1.CDS.1 [Saccharomyces cerevisiae]|nr:ATV_HP_G0015020.mRNA.1.CDS.1 [Saccharomyces cerevisiae]CAI6949988.1 ATV_HP_G0015020.mRNA.1.CDS.1 [Saccharomyces cerevisiae]